MITVVIHKDEKIQPGQFKGRQDIERVIVEAEATVPQQAFEKCSNITHVTLGHGATIWDSAFKLCQSIATLDIIGEDVWIGELSFYACDKIKMVKITKDSIVNQYAFSLCTEMEKILIEPGALISSDAFIFCKKLQEVSISNATVQKGGFSSCTIAKLSIGQNTKMSFGSFMSCKFQEVSCVDMSSDEVFFIKCQAGSVSTYGKTNIKIVKDRFKVDRFKVHSGSSVIGFDIDHNITGLIGVNMASVYAGYFKSTMSKLFRTHLTIETCEDEIPSLTALSAQCLAKQVCPLMPVQFDPETAEFGHVYVTKGSFLFHKSYEPFYYAKGDGSTEPKYSFRALKQIRDENRFKTDYAAFRECTLTQLVIPEGMVIENGQSMWV